MFITGALGQDPPTPTVTYHKKDNFAGKQRSSECQWNYVKVRELCNCLFWRIFTKSKAELSFLCYVTLASYSVDQAFNSSKNDNFSMKIV